MTDIILTSLKTTGMYLLQIFIDGSYYICLTTSACGLLAYLAGFKKGTRWTTLSILIYTTLQLILGALK